MSRQPGNDVDEGFIGRWSRRKSAEARTDEAPTIPVDSDPAEDALPLNQVVPGHTPGRMQTMVEADRLKEAADGPVGKAKPVLTDEDMPPLESLDEGGDFSGFLSPGVSEKLRRAAMRKLFSAAVFNVRDGLDDYDEDFTNFEPLGDIVTSDMKHQAEVAERRRREAEEAASQEAAAAEAESAEVEESSQVAQESETGPSAEPEAGGEIAGDEAADDPARVARNEVDAQQDEDEASTT